MTSDKPLYSLKDFNLLTPQMLAGIFGLTEDTLRRWRAQSIGPRFIYVGRYVFYRYMDIYEWVESRDGHGGTAGEKRSNVSGGDEPPPINNLSEANPYSNFARAPSDGCG